MALDAAAHGGMCLGSTRCARARGGTGPASSLARNDDRASAAAARRDRVARVPGWLWRCRPSPPPRTRAPAGHRGIQSALRVAAAPQRRWIGGRVRVLVTGATGFIGRRLIDHLLGAGHEVVAAVRRPAPELDPDRVRIVAVRLDDREGLTVALEGCDGVVHLAVATGTTSEREAYDVNVVGTEHLLEAARRAGVGRFVFASTIS